MSVENIKPMYGKQSPEGNQYHGTTPVEIIVKEHEKIIDAIENGTYNLHPIIKKNMQKQGDLEKITLS